MRKRTQVAIYSGASVLWAMAVLGAVGVARWLELSTRDTVLLVLSVALIAIVGAFLPAVQLALERWRKSQQGDASDAQTGMQRRE